MRENGNDELATDIFHCPLDIRFVNAVTNEFPCARIAAGQAEVLVLRWSGIHNALPCRLTGPKVGFDSVKRGGGRRRIRTFVGVSQQIYSLPSLAT